MLVPLEQFVLVRCQVGIDHAQPDPTDAKGQRDGALVGSDAKHAGGREARLDAIDLGRVAPMCKDDERQPPHAPLRHAHVRRAEVRVEGHQPVLIRALLRRDAVEVVFGLLREPAVEQRRRHRVAHVPAAHP